MPQASEELRARWGAGPYGCGADAMSELYANFTQTKGVYRLKDKDYEPTEDEWSALQYMCDEWDFGYEGENS